MPPLWRPVPTSSKHAPWLLPRGFAVGGPAPTDAWPKFLAMPTGAGLFDACGLWHGYETANEAHIVHAATTDTPL